MRVLLVKQRHQNVEHPGALTFDDGDHLVLEATWSFPEARDLGFAVFEPGDVFTEHYWRGRWFSVKVGMRSMS